MNNSGKKKDNEYTRGERERENMYNNAQTKLNSHDGKVWCEQIELQQQLDIFPFFA